MGSKAFEDRRPLDFGALWRKFDASRLGEVIGQVVSLHGGGAAPDETGSFPSLEALSKTQTCADLETNPAPKFFATESLLLVQIQFTDDGFGINNSSHEIHLDAKHKLRAANEVSNAFHKLRKRSVC